MTVKGIAFIITYCYYMLAKNGRNRWSTYNATPRKSNIEDYIKMPNRGEYGLAYDAKFTTVDR